MFLKSLVASRIAIRLSCSFATFPRATVQLIADDALVLEEVVAKNSDILGKEGLR